MRKQTPTIEWTVTESDALYLTLAHNLGLSLIPMPEKLYTAVSMIQRPGLTPIHYHPVQSISVPSPALYRAPGTLTDTEVLAQSLMLPLFDDLLARAKVQYAIRPIWQPLLSGLRLWQLWDLDLPLSIWRTAMVQWAYADLPGSTAEQFATLQLPYAEICAAHQLWLRYPAQIHIPLWCGDPDQQIVTLVPHTAPRQLAQLALLTRHYTVDNGHGETEQTYHPSQAVALATLFEYAVATHGRTLLPKLIAGLGQHDTWETLIPAIYGISAVEFEAGWQAYLAARYSVQ